MNKNNYEIKVHIKNVFGIDRIYPSCDNSELFCKIAKTATLTLETIGLIKRLGYKIMVVQSAKEL